MTKLVWPWYGLTLKILERNISQKLFWAPIFLRVCKGVFRNFGFHLIQYDRSIDLHLNFKKNIARLGRSSRDIGLVPVEPGSERTP